MRGADQRGGGLRAQQTRHVLDGQHVRTGLDDLLGQSQVVVQGVQRLGRIRQITGIAHRDFGYRRARFADGVDGGRIDSTLFSASKIR